MLPIDFYHQNLSILENQKSSLLKKKKAIGLLRSGNIVLVFLLFYYLYSVNLTLAIVLSVLLIFIFTRLIYADLNNKQQISHIEKLISIQHDEINLIRHIWHGKTGEEYLTGDHVYANDMDIFGHASLFQFINRTTSEPGQDKLASWLLEPAAKDVILKRQDTIKELAAEPKWRQDLMAFGKGANLQNKTVSKLGNWAADPTRFIQWKPWGLLRWALPVPILIITVTTIFELNPVSWFLITLFFYAVIAYQINKQVAPLHEQLSRIVDQLESVSHTINHIENKSFQSELLKDLQKEFYPGLTHSSSEIKKLKLILERLDLRYNIVVSAPLNLLLLWNLQQVLDLEKWKEINGNKVSVWIDTLAEFESLNSLASLAFNHPEWAFPGFSEKHFELNAKELGHPLIPASKMVYNDVQIIEAEYIMLVTGSNMAGKSTFLRSTGIAIIMGMCGAPVCARSMKFSPVQLLSSMRITDNLEESTSTFYAELKKLKLIIEAVNRNEQVFILLDEILRGTNSMDRHKGSEALIKQLIKMKASAIIATHDLALAGLEKDFPEEIENYHFDVSIRDEDLYFDYKLKPGVCKSLNATILMKKIGIEI